MRHNLVPADQNDALAIATLHVESWRSAYRGLVPDEFLAGPVVENRRHLWDTRMAEPEAGRLVLKAVEGDVMVGFTCVRRDADVAWGPLLDNLHVTPGRKGSGIGWDLFRASRAWSSLVAPGQPMHLWVIEGNAQACRFYDRQRGAIVERRVIELTPGVHVPALRYVWK